MAKEQGLKFTLGSDTRDKKPEDLTTLTDCNRHPNGITGESFYFKDVTGTAPEWVETFKYKSPKTRCNCFNSFALGGSKKRFKDE